jgi:glycine/D-amino acid oxidase-like deaminating enzyme
MLELGGRQGGNAMTRSIFTPDLKLDPYWWEAAPRPGLPEAALPRETDVAIVGSGFSGLSAALTLARAGRAVTVFDAEDPGFGASSRNGGMCGGSLKLSYSVLRGKLGRDKAAALYRDGQAGLDYIEHLIEREQIHCHFARMGRFTGAWAPGHYDTMAREAELLRKEVGVETHMVTRSEQHTEIGTDLYHGGRVFPRDGGLHPALYHQGLLERVINAGARIVANTPVTGMARGSGGFTVTTPRGGVAARDVIVATNGYTGRATPWFRRRLIPVGSFMIATEPLPAETMARLNPNGRMLTDSKRILYYYRPSPDGTRVLFGGRAAFGGTEDLRATGKTLHGFMTRVFPDLADARISHSWTGFVAFAFDRLPHSGVRDGIHYAMGYNGSGVVKGTWLGHKTALHILGDAEAGTPLFGGPFPTMPFYTGVPWFLPIVSAWYHLRDRTDR